MGYANRAAAYREEPAVRQETEEFQLVLANPERYEDAGGIARHFDARHPVVLNLEACATSSGVALYSRQDAQDLELAYAATVHKSQGSEFEAVVVPLYHNQRQLCYRNLLYTAVTRAKSLLILVGSRDTIQEMVENNRKTLRYSGLRYFLLEAGAMDL